METLSSAAHQLGGTRPALRTVSRTCRFEQLEPRQLLAADLASGAPDLSSGTTGGRTGQISGNVYASQQASCDAHHADAALIDVRVQLLDENGAVLEESFTDSQGTYTFADLLPGQYAVRQITSHGFLDGASVVGAGGGIAFGTNVVGEIIVQAGETLDGYDFCDFENVLEPPGPSDRPIIPHQSDPLLVPPIQLPTVQTNRDTRQELIDQPAIESATVVSFLALSPLNRPKPAEVFGGSSQSLNESEAIKAWDDYLLDDLFAQAGFLDLESATPSDIDAIVDFLDEIDNSRDTPFADGYTVNSVEWWDDEARLELDELFNDGKLTQFEGEHAASRTKSVVEIARRDQPNQPQ